MRNSKLTPVILLLPLMAVTLTVIIACVNVLLQSIGYVPAFGLTKITLGLQEVFKRPEFLSALWVSLRIAFVSTLLAAALGTLLCAALVKRRAGGGMLYGTLPHTGAPHGGCAVHHDAAGPDWYCRPCGIRPGLISDYTKFPQILFTPGYGGAIAGYLWKEIPFVAYYTLALMASVSNTLRGGGKPWRIAL